LQAILHDVLRAGLETAAWITVDDTGARHKAKNGYCTQIGNDHFAWFGTTGSKVSGMSAPRFGISCYLCRLDRFWVGRGVGHGQQR
jgi:hypothetical protein